MDLLSKPEAGTEYKRYQKIPQTPPPRAHRVDKSLYMPQKKMEKAMHLLVQQVENTENGADGHKAMAQAACQIRSAWEDLNQNRRHLLAGRASNHLQKRSDDNRPRLLTTEEEEKIDKSKKVMRPFQKPRASRFWGDATSSITNNWKNPRQRSFSQGKGKGKGKGKAM